MVHRQLRRHLARLRRGLHGAAGKILKLRDPYSPDDTPIFLLPAVGTTPAGILTLDHTIYKIADEETMRQMKEMKATNMAFEEAYAVTQEEWDEMRRRNQWTIGNLLTSKTLQKRNA